jgi:hypothetical protein
MRLYAPRIKRQRAVGDYQLCTKLGFRYESSVMRWGLSARPGTTQSYLARKRAVRLVTAIITEGLWPSATVLRET